MPSFKLASQRFSGGGNDKLRPVLLSESNAMASIRAPQMNPSVGQIGFTPFQAPAITGSPVAVALQGVATIADTIAEESIKLQQRQDKVYVETEIGKLNDELRALFYGDENGLGGYSSAKMGDAVSGRAGFHHQVETAVSNRLKNMTPQQRVMALSQFATLRDSYLNKGASHAVAELQRAEADVVDKKYTQAMNEAELSLLSGDAPNADMLRAALDGYRGDAAEFAKRRTAMTEAILYRTPPDKLSEVAQMLFSDPTVADAKTVYDFLEGRKEDIRDDERWRRQQEEQRRTDDAFARGEAERVVKTHLVDNLYGGLTATDPTVLPSLVRAAETALPAGQAEPLISAQVTEAVSGLIRREQDPGARSITAEKIRMNIGSLPIYAQDEAYAALDSELAAADDRARQKLERQIAMTDAERKLRQEGLNGSVATIRAMKEQGATVHDSRYTELVDSVFSDPDATEGQKKAVSDIVNGENSPWEPMKLRELEQNWDSVVAGKQPLDRYLRYLSVGKQEEILKRFDQDRRTNAATPRSLGVGYIEKLFHDPNQSLQSNKFLPPENQDVTLARQNATILYHGFFDNEMGKGVGPMEAMNTALAKVLASEQFRLHMPALLKVNAAQGERKPTYNEVKVDEMSRDFPMGAIPGLDGPTDLVAYVEQLGKDAQTNPLPMPPKAMVERRIAETYQGLGRKLEAATTVEDVQYVYEQIRNFMAQQAHVEQLVPVGGSSGSDTISPVDGDSGKTGSGGQFRFKDINTEEMSTPEGQKRLQQLNRLLQVTTGNTNSVYLQNHGSGAFHRGLSSGYVGWEYPASIEVMMQELGSPLYVPPGSKSKEGETPK